MFQVYKNGNIKIKYELDGKINYSFHIDYGFKTFETIDEEELRYLVKDLT